MNTHNIGFYEDLTKIIFELSSNIIKYAPYSFCYYYISTINIKISSLYLVSVAVQTGLCLTLSETPKTCFLEMQPK